MRKFLGSVVLFSALLGAIYVHPAQGQATLTMTTEVLVSNTGFTELPHLTNRRGIEIQNLGPNAIWCSLNANVADGGSAIADGGNFFLSGRIRKISSGAVWSMDAEFVRIFCIADTAAQVAGAATIVTEIR